ncbi:MAG: hypothetical protein QM765_00170 [Myxococcales bacterium]
MPPKTKTSPADGQTKQKSWLEAPLMTLDQAHALLQALARTGQLIIQGSDDEEVDGLNGFDSLHHPA